MRHGCFWVIDRCQGQGVFGVFPALLDGLNDQDPKVRQLVRGLLARRLRAMPRSQFLNLRLLTHRGLIALIDEILALEPLPAA